MSELIVTSRDLEDGTCAFDIEPGRENLKQIEAPGYGDYAFTAYQTEDEVVVLTSPMQSWEADVLIAHRRVDNRIQIVAHDTVPFDTIGAFIATHLMAIFNHQVTGPAAY